MGKEIKALKCIHRHDINSHPACFAKGLINFEFESDRQWEQMTGLPWYQFPGYKIGYLDIEVDNLKANFGNMLTWSIKEKGGETFYDIIEKKELFDETYDRRIVQSIIDKMREFKIVVTYYGTGFDIPYIRSKALHYGIDFPGFIARKNARGKFYYISEIYHFDLYYTVRAKMQLHRSSLAAATEYLGIAGKTPIDYEIWRRAKYGNEKALAEVLSHNIADVEILEKLHVKLSPFRSWTRRGI